MKIGRITFGEAYSEDALNAVINSHRQAVPYAFSAVDFTIIVKTSPTSILNLTMNMGYLVEDMDDQMKTTAYGAGVSAIPFSVLKLVFAAIFFVIAIVQLTAIY